MPARLATPPGSAPHASGRRAALLAIVAVVANAKLCATSPRSRCAA
jgi:hypothetical protein